jgi:polyisoprenyl-phosphate glycosyltransferase
MVTICLIGTAILLCIGLIGEYLGRVFEAVKQRPLYVVARTLGTEDATAEGPSPPPVRLRRANEEEIESRRR